MGKIQWEDDFVEKHFYGQLEAMSWQWLEDDTDVPELANLLTGRVRVPEEFAVAPSTVLVAGSHRSASPTEWLLAPRNPSAAGRWCARRFRGAWRIPAGAKLRGQRRNQENSLYAAPTIRCPAADGGAGSLAEYGL